MANVVITLKIMPENPEVDMSAIEQNAKSKIEEFSGSSEMKVDIQPVAFGIKSLNITFVSDEERGSTEQLEESIRQLEGVNSVEVTDVRRSIG